MKPQPKLTQYIESIIEKNRSLEKKVKELEAKLLKSEEEKTWMRKVIPAHLQIDGVQIVSKGEKTE